MSSSWAKGLKTHVNKDVSKLCRNTTLSISNNQLHVSAIYSYHHAKCSNISRKKLPTQYVAPYVTNMCIAMKNIYRMAPSAYG